MFNSKEAYLNNVFKKQKHGMDLIRSLVDEESYNEQVLRDLHRRQFNLELIIKIFHHEEVGYDMHWIMPRLLEKDYMDDLVNILEHSSIGLFWRVKIIKFIIEEGNVNELEELTKVNRLGDYKDRVDAQYVLLKLASS